MAGYIKRNPGRIIGIAAAAVLCLTLVFLLIRQQKAYRAAQAAFENERAAFALQLGQSDELIQNLTVTVDNLNSENAGLNEQLQSYGITGSRDVIIIDRAIPLELLDTVMTYYKARDEKDLEAFKSVIVSEDSEFYNDILSSYNAESGPKYAEIKSVLLGDTSSENDADIKDASFKGTVFLVVNGYYLYFTRESGRWLAYWWD